MEHQPMEEQFEEKEIHLSDYIMVLQKRKTLIILVFILTISTTMLFTFMADPIYQSSANLIIDKEKSSPITGERTDFDNYNSQIITFNTSIKMITSTPVVKEVITSLKLDAEDATRDLGLSFVKELITQFKSNIKLLLKKDQEEELSFEEAQNLKMQGLIETVKEKISVEQVRDTRLLNLSVKDKDPELAAAIVNTLARKYIEFDLSNNMDSSKQTLEWLNNELYALRKKLEDDEKKFFEYKQANKVFSITGKQKLAEFKIQEFNNKYLETRNQRLELDAKISELGKHITGSRNIANVRSLISNPMIESLYIKIVDTELELTGLSRTFKAKHPKVIQAKSELEKTENRLAQEIQKERDNLRSQRTVLFAKEQTLENTIKEFETDALDTSGKELNYTMLQRNMNTSQNLYDLMVSRMKESNILKTSSTSNIRLVETAQVPIAPVSPNKKRNLMLSIVLGLFGGVGLAFVFEYLDQTIRTEEDIKNYLTVPILSVIPEADRSETNGYGARS